MNVTIHPQDLARRRQRLRNAFALKVPIPTAILLHDPTSTTLGGNFTALTQTRRTRAWHHNATAHETQRAIAVWKH